MWNRKLEIYDLMDLFVERVTCLWKEKKMFEIANCNTGIWKTIEICVEPWRNVWNRKLQHRALNCGIRKTIEICVEPWRNVWNSKLQHRALNCWIRKTIEICVEP